MFNVEKYFDIQQDNPASKYSQLMQRQSCDHRFESPVGVGIAKEVTIRFVSRFTCHDAILSRCIAILELLRCIAMHCEFSLNTVKKKLSHYQWLTGCV